MTSQKPSCRVNGISLPSVDEVVEAYIEDEDYLDECVAEECEFDQKCFMREAEESCIDEVRNSYDTVADAIRASSGKSVYRMYDYGWNPDDERNRFDKMVASLLGQLRRGVIRAATKRECDVPSIEIESGTSWSPNKPRLPRTVMKEEWESGKQVTESHVFIEAILDVGKMSIFETFFIYAKYSGGQSGMEFKIKHGAPLFVKNFHHYDINNDKMIVDVVNRPIVFE